MKQLKLSIIIGTYNRKKQLQKCVEGILVKPRANHEIIIVDAGSTDGTVRFLKKISGKVKVIIQKEKIGQAKSLNQIFKKIKSEYVCWLSDDNIIRDDALEETISILDADDSIGMVGLKVKDISGPFSKETYIGGIWPSGILNVNQGMVRTKILKKIGFFDETFPDYGIDADLTTKILLEGHKVVLSKKIAIFHMRNYRQYPGAYQKKERDYRLEIALHLYKQKYKNLCDRYYKKRILFLESASNILRTVLSHIYGFSRFGFSAEKMLGFERRDIINCFESEFVSKLDLWYNRKKSYYLVQFIPKTYRNEYKA